MNPQPADGPDTKNPETPESPQTSILSVSGARAAMWEATGMVTVSARGQLSLLLADREWAATMARRFANVGDGQRQGHVFEWLHELSFNLNAVASNADIRLKMTERMGAPHDPADLRLFDTAGRTVGEFQAKVVSSTSTRLSTTKGLAAEKYAGMGLLVPTDHLEGTQSLLNSRLAMPEGPLHHRYRGVKENLDDRVSGGSIESRRVTLAELKSAAEDPDKYLRKRIQAAQAQQLAGATFVAAMVGGIVDGGSVLASAAIRERSVSELPWAEAARRAASGSVSSAAKAVLGQSISIASQHALANGVAPAMSSIIGGTLSAAMAQCTVEIAAIAHGTATGRLSTLDAASAAAESMTRTTMIWAFGAMGQVLIPVPLLGSMIGGMVGQYGAAMLIQGIQMALIARDESKQWDAGYEQLLVCVEQIERDSAAELSSIEEQTKGSDTAFNQFILPQLAAISQTLGSSNPDALLNQLGHLSVHYGGKPVFTTLAEFDAFMDDPMLTLNLRLS